MEITIVTGKVNEVSIDEIRKTLEDAGYPIAYITVVDSATGTPVAAARYEELA